MFCSSIVCENFLLVIQSFKRKQTGLKSGMIAFSYLNGGAEKWNYVYWPLTGNVQ
ncbi:MAG: hypothetical protein MRK00_10080 [Nitrosomonas sp.]|nr:hypothetical protein [Nitrosomonas sp.]